ncbi:peptidoglycan binding domain-containing protein, partial [Nocardioides sp.]|uniref:peptidoglycan binding domain-containing protein n=1 Tax=Nocardioides sp. TaxID=35761 RepID=UPI00286BD66B
MSLWDETTREPDARRERNGGRVVLLVLVGLALLAGGGYAAAYLAAGDKVPRGTTVAGVDVGGRTQAEAVLALEAGLSERSTAPIAVSVDGTTEEVDPEQAGLAVDYAASVEAAGGEESWEPGRLWDYFTGGDDLDAVVTVDDAAMTGTVDELIKAAGTLPRNGDIDFRGNRVKVTDPVVGEAIDADEASAALEAAYLQ